MGRGSTRSARSRTLFAKQRTPTAGLASRLELAACPAAFCVNHIQQMLLEAEVRLVGKLIGIGINSQHVHVQVLDGILVPGALEMNLDSDPCDLGGHEQPLSQSLTNSEKWDPRFGIGEGTRNRHYLEFPWGWEDVNLPGIGKTSAS